MNKLLVSDNEELRRLLNGFPPQFRDAARALFVRGYREGMKDRKDKPSTKDELL